MAVSAEAAPFPEGKPKKKLKCEPVQFASKDSFDFGKVFLDENASVSEALTNPVTNPTVQIVFQVAEPNPPFPIERTDCNSLNPGAQCHIVVDFKPPKVGKYHGKLEVTYAGCPDAEHGKSSKLKLSGIGVAAQRTPTPTPTPCTSCSTATPTPTATQTATPTSTATPINRTATGLQIGASSFGNGDSYPLFGPCVADGGCTGMPPQDAPSAVANAVTPFSTCGTPVSIALGGGPPTVGVSGNVVVTCARTTPESSEIQCVASSDGGKTFGGIISPVESSGFSSAVVGAMDAHGAFHVLYQHTDNNFANLHNHSAILPPGTNFSPVLDLGANFDSSPDAIAVDLVTGSIYVTTSALDTNIQGNKLIEVRKSTDGGASFGSPVTVASVSSSMGGGFRAMTAKNDSVFIVYGTFDGSNNSTEVGYLSTDGGATFQSVGNLLTANGATVTQQTVQFLNGTEPPPSTTLSGFASGSSNQNAFYLRGDDSIVIGVQDGSGAMHLKQNTSANPSSFSDIVISNDSNISGSACAGNDTYAVCTWPTSTGAPANQLINFAARCSP